MDFYPGVNRAWHNNTSKSYVQALKQFDAQISKLANNTMEVIKINDTFPTLMLWNALDTNNFYFIWFYFSDFILILFCFLLDDEEARDTIVTWQITWYDVIGLKYSERSWKMTSGHMYTIWWPWVENEADIRL